MKIKKLICFVFSFSFFFCVFSQQQIKYNGCGNYSLRERTDLRRYDNGKYIGLVSREVTSFINPVYCENGYQYEGNFYINEMTNRNYAKVGNSINDYIYSSFKIDEKGNLQMISDYGFPTFRSFPAFPEKKIKKGDSWNAQAQRVVDPLNKGIVTKMPIYVQYQYVDDVQFNGEPVFLLTAQWATRYGMGSGTYHIDFGGDSELQKATGSHKATIYVSKKTGNAVVIRDTVDETFFYADGNAIQFKGTISLFTEYPPSVDTSDLIPVLKRICNLTDEEADYLAKKENSNPLVFEQLSDNYLDDLSDDLSEEFSQIIKGEITNHNDKNRIAGNESEFVENELADRHTFSNEKNSNEKNSNEFVKEDIVSLDSFSKKDNSREKNVQKKKNQIDLEVERTPAGIKLSIQNLQFKPDSAELLDSEKQRLSQIAEILKTVPSAKLLVEGHTASTGNQTGEMKLSIERANAIASSLIKLGIPSENFICRGLGGSKPVSDNKTAEGKAKNRRVEITILE